MDKIWVRIILDLLLLMAVVQGWWHVALILGLLGLWAFRNYLEAFAGGLIFDSLYGMMPGTGVAAYYGIAVSIAIYAIFWFIKDKLRKKEALRLE